MANESVAIEPSREFYLPLDAARRGDELLYKARGVLECIQAASDSGDELPACAVSNACWAVASMLEEMHGIISTERPAGERVGVEAHA